MEMSLLYFAELTSLYQSLLHDAQSLKKEHVSKLFSISRDLDINIELSSFKDVMLLQLTDLKMLFDECRVHLDLRNIIYDLLREEGIFLHSLIGYVKNGDRFIKYAACNVVKSALTVLPIKLVPEDCFQVLGTMLRNKDGDAGNVCCIFQNVLSVWKKSIEMPQTCLTRECEDKASPYNRQNLPESLDRNIAFEIDINIVLKVLTIINEYWGSVVPNLVQEWPSWLNHKQEAFLSLWLTVLKLSLNSNGREMLDTLAHGNASLQCLYLYPSVLFDILMNTTEQDRYVRKKILSIYICCLGDPCGMDTHDGIHSIAMAIQQKVASGCLERLHFQTKRVGFGGMVIQRSDGSSDFEDHSLLRNLCLLVLKSTAALVKNTESAERKDLAKKHIKLLLQYLNDKLPTKSLSSWWQVLGEIFADQDDLMVETMLYLLEIYMKAPENCYNPHMIFSRFLTTVTYDHTVLLDMLISPETCFLAYLVKYLKLVIQDWKKFQLGLEIKLGISVTDMLVKNEGNNSVGMLSSHLIPSSGEDELHTSDEKLFKENKINASPMPVTAGENVTGSPKGAALQMTPKHETLIAKNLVEYSDSEESDEERKPPFEHGYGDSVSDSILDQTMSVLIRLNYSVERMYDKGLIPFNVHPLLRLLSQVETFYEM